jgi:hypothetical protein
MKSNKVYTTPFLFLTAFVLIFSSVGCNKIPGNNFREEIDSIGMKWVPDGREGVFSAGLYSSGGELILRGETNIREAREDIIALLKSKDLKFTDSLKILPDTSETEKTWGLVNVSTCNIRANPSHSAEMTSQALMGTPVKILKEDGGWVLVQTPDSYIGWVDSGIVIPESDEDHSEWKSSSRIFYTGKTGDICNEKDEVISDVVAGCMLVTEGKKDGNRIVRLPDGRTGLIPEGKAVPFDDLDTKYLKPGNLVSCAKSFTGIPYLWGGTSVKGFDCSGFVKTVYYLNGIILARDASLQFRHGINIGDFRNIDSLKAGDLLFFGSVRDGKPRATHVAMYIGDTEYINASGMITVNSLDSTRADFSKYRRNSFLGARRIIGADYGKGIQPLTGHSWYK